MSERKPDGPGGQRRTDRPASGPKRRFSAGSSAGGSTKGRSDRPAGASRPSGKTSGAQGGSGKNPKRGAGPQRSSGKSSGPRPAKRDRDGARPAPARVGPPIDEDVTGRELPKAVREELRTLSRESAEVVAGHLVMADRVMDEDPVLAWAHAKAAVSRGARLALVREAAGVAAYRAGEYAEALAQLRAARRISGSDAYWPLMADCERGLGRPERAVAMAGAPEVARLDEAGQVEMRIVAAGARRDQGLPEAALVTLQCPALTSRSSATWVPRLRYAYADLLAELGREQEARDWFTRAAEADRHGETDAAERLAELEGVVWLDPQD